MKKNINKSRVIKRNEKIIESKGDMKEKKKC